MRTDVSVVLVGLLFTNLSLVASSLTLLNKLEKGKNILSTFPAYHKVETKNVLQCQKLCQHQAACFLSTYNVKEMNCHLYNVTSMTAEVITDPVWILFNNSQNGERVDKTCIRTKNNALISSASCDFAGFRYQTPDSCLSIKRDNDHPPRDCLDVRDRGGVKSGVYTVFPCGLDKNDTVFCDQETDGGGWLLFQRRMDASENFYRNWADYENGFGNLEREFWLGNYFTSAISNQRGYELRVDMEDFENNTRYATYNRFTLGDASTTYKLTVDGYSGTAGDSLSYHSGQVFVTKDQDSTVKNCVNAYHGGFWYRSCHTVNVNGLYLYGLTDLRAQGIIWLAWKGYDYSLRFTELKIRPNIYT